MNSALRELDGCYCPVEHVCLLCMNMKILEDSYVHTLLISMTHVYDKSMNLWLE